MPFHIVETNATTETSEEVQAPKPELVELKVEEDTALSEHPAFENVPETDATEEQNE